MKSFTLKTFPEQRFHYNILIISAGEPYLTNLIQYCLNTFGELENSQDGIKTSNNKRVNIIDLSPDEKFINLVPEKVRGNVIGNVHRSDWNKDFNLSWWIPGWLRDFNIKKLLCPNTVVRENNNQNFLYNIWLAEHVDKIPTILLSMTNLFFITSTEELDILFKKKKITSSYSISNDIMIVITSALNLNIEFMTTLKSRFLNG